MNDVNAQFQEFFSNVVSFLTDHHVKNMPSSIKAPEIKYTQGRKYFKVIKDTSVFCFVLIISNF